MITVTPRYLVNGWRHNFSGLYVATDDSGAVGTSIRNMQTGEILASINAWFQGWWSFDSVQVGNDAPGGEQLTWFSASGVRLPCPDAPAISKASVAADGHRASCVAGVIYFDGHEIARSEYYIGAKIAGNGWVATYSSERRDVEPEWRHWVAPIWHLGTLQRTVIHQVPASEKAINADGSYVYGDTARVFLNEPDNATTEISATVERQEFCPTIAWDGSGRRWAWSPVGAKADQLLARVVGASVGWLMQLPFGCSGLSVTWANSAWQLCWHDATGRCGVADVTLATADAQPLPIRLTPLAPLPNVRLDLDKTEGQAPLTVHAAIVELPGSGPTPTKRYLVDGVIDKTGNDQPVHDLILTEAGSHLLAARVANGGIVMQTQSQLVTVTAAPPPPPPTRPFTGIVAMFGYPTTDERMRQIVTNGVQAVRTPLHGKPDEVIAQLRRFPSLTPYYAIEAYNLDQMRAQMAALKAAGVLPGTLAGFGNEDLSGRGTGDPHPDMAASHYAANANVFRPLADALGLKVYYGAVGNLGRDLAWLKEVRRLCSWMEQFEVHHYPTALEQASEKNIADLKAVIGDKHFIVGEMGCLCGPKAIEHKLWFIKWYTSIFETQQRDWFIAAKRRWATVPGFDGAFWYQIGSGTATTSHGLNGPEPQATPRLAWQGFRT